MNIGTIGRQTTCQVYGFDRKPGKYRGKELRFLRFAVNYLTLQRRNRREYLQEFTCIHTDDMVLVDEERQANAADRLQVTGNRAK